MELIYEKRGADGAPAARRSPTCPCPRCRPSSAAPSPPRLPELPENEIVRHFTKLADRNFGIDTGFYPLGSCTMKHNPRVNERAVGLPGFREPAPAAGGRGRAGRARADVGAAADPRRGGGPAGGHAAAGGRLAGRADRPDADARVLRRSRRGRQRDTIITADTAHGTNPASVTMAGYKLEKVATTERGNLDLDDLRAKVNERTAGLMLTNPSTLGLFDEGIAEVADIFHDQGALLYYDGANLNAVVGISRPGDMGFDIVHYNLHKTFSQPHGGGGPGGGPVAVRAELEPFLPSPTGRARRRRVPARPRPPAVDRPRARLRRAVRCVRALVRVHARVRTGAAGDVRDGGAQRELRPRAAAGRVRAAVRPALHARVRALGAGAQDASTASPRSTSRSG